jgi:eukaryotic translation initiation factor 2C
VGVAAEEAGASAAAIVVVVAEAFVVVVVIVVVVEGEAEEAAAAVVEGQKSGYSGMESSFQAYMLHLSTLSSHRDPDTPLAGPDMRVMKIEDAFMKSASGLGAMAGLKLTADFPRRPGHGTQGKKITVYANYFRLQTAPSLNFTRYNVTVAPEATGKKLKRIFQLLLELPDFAGVATEYKSLLIARQRLNIPDPYEITIHYRAEGQDEPLERATRYQVRVVTPTTLAVADLVNHLSSTDAGSTFGQRDEVIQGLNALMGNQPQAQDGVVSIGQNRHFSIDRSLANQHNIRILGGGLESLRGYYQSARPATGGILLNVNVTHGVFLEPVRLDVIYPKLGTGNKNTLQKKLKTVRVEVTHLQSKKSKKTNQNIPVVKTIFGLAHDQDGRRDAHPPMVKSFGAGPKDVKFWLADRPLATAGGKSTDKGKTPKKATGPELPSNAYISVFDYFRKSKLR